jgi:hypothetical protein
VGRGGGKREKEDWLGWLAGPFGNMRALQFRSQSLPELRELRSEGGLPVSRPACRVVEEKHLANYCEYFELAGRVFVPKAKETSREAKARAQLKNLLGD